jgi:hypothetical protein
LLHVLVFLFVVFVGIAIFLSFDCNQKTLANNVGRLHSDIPILDTLDRAATKGPCLQINQQTNLIRTTTISTLLLCWPTQHTLIGPKLALFFSEKKRKKKKREMSRCSKLSIIVLRWQIAVVVLLGNLPESTSYDLNYNPKLQSCNSIATDIKYGPSSVIKNLTDPEYYDFRKRPNAAYIIDEGASHLPDRTFVTLHLRSVVSINQIEQTMTTRYHTHIYTISNIKTTNKA